MTLMKSYFQLKGSLELLLNLYRDLANHDKDTMHCQKSWWVQW